MEKLILISVLWSLGGCATYLPNGTVPPEAQDVVCEKHGTVLVTPENILSEEEYQRFGDATIWIRRSLESSKCFETVEMINGRNAALASSANSVLLVRYELKPGNLLAYANVGLTVLTLGIIPSYETYTYTVQDLRQKRGELIYKRASLISTFLLFRKNGQMVVDSIDDERKILTWYLFK